MRDGLLIAAAGALVVGAWMFTRSNVQSSEQEPVDDTVPSTWTNEVSGAVEAFSEPINDAVQEVAGMADQITGGMLKVSKMSHVTPWDVQNPNVRAMLRVIRRGEGTASDTGYRTLFGGSLFNDFADHPRVKITRGAYTSTAAGAYQFLSSTWDETARIMGLTDFSPASQDMAAVGRIAARGALEDVKAGRVEAALRKIGREWASMPGSPYGQPTISLDTAKSVFALAGGADTATA